MDENQSVAADVKITLALMQKDIELLKIQVSELADLKLKVSELYWQINSLRDAIAGLETNLVKATEKFTQNQHRQQDNHHAAANPNLNPILDILIKIIGALIVAGLALMGIRLF